MCAAIEYPPSAGSTQHTCWVVSGGCAQNHGLGEAEHLLREQAEHERNRCRGGRVDHLPVARVMSVGLDA